MFNKCCPISRKKINKNSINNPWLTSKLKNAIRKKNKLFNTYKTKNCPIIFIKYKKLKNKINKNIKYEKNKYYSNIFSNCNQKENWTHLNTIINQNVDELPKILKYEGKEIINIKDQCEHFNNYFSNVGFKINESFLNKNMTNDNLINDNMTSDNMTNDNITNDNDFRYFLNSIENSFYFLPITDKEIINITLNMKSKSSKDINNWDMKLIKLLINSIAKPLEYLFNLCLANSEFPDNMKISIIKPVFKANDKKQIINYRPISLLPQISKIFEKIIYNRMMDFIYKNKIINDNQYGFVEKSNTTLSHFNLQHFLFTKHSLNKKIATLFLDLKKAFDVVDNDILLKKLEYCGFRGYVNVFLKNYLLDRKVKTRINNTVSFVRNVRFGVPQGSVLGPLFFIIFINDISNIFNNDDNINLNIYADDTSLSIFANSNEELSSNMQLYLDRLCHWFNINKLKLNIEKTKILPYFNTKIINNINLNNVNIEIVDRYTFLGIILDSNLTYSFHIINLCNKLSKIVYLFRKLKFLNLRNLIILYNLLFLSNMSYGIEIWGNVYEDRLKKLVLIQKKTIRIINKNMIDKSQLPLIRLSHTNNMFKYNSILKFNELITFRIILFLYNLLHNNYNINLDTFFIYNKDKTRFILPLMKTTKFQNTIFFKGPKYYNNIMSNNILKSENIHNIHKLKKVLKNYFLNKY